MTAKTSNDTKAKIKMILALSILLGLSILSQKTFGAECYSGSAEVSPLARKFLKSSSPTQEIQLKLKEEVCPGCMTVTSGTVSLNGEKVVVADECNSMPSYLDLMFLSAHRPTSEVLDFIATYEKEFGLNASSLKSLSICGIVDDGGQFDFRKSKSGEKILLYPSRARSEIEMAKHCGDASCRPLYLPGIIGKKPVTLTKSVCK
jgi:hypothetical protein